MVCSYPPEERCNGCGRQKVLPHASARLGLSSTALADPWFARRRVDLSARCACAAAMPLPDFPISSPACHSSPE